METLEARDVAHAAGTLYPGMYVAGLIVQPQLGEGDRPVLFARRNVRSDNQRISGRWEIPGVIVDYGKHMSEGLWGNVHDLHGLSLDLLRGVTCLDYAEEIVCGGGATVSHLVAHPLIVRYYVEDGGDRNLDPTLYTDVGWFRDWDLLRMNPTGLTRDIVQRIYANYLTDVEVGHRR